MGDTKSGFSNKHDGMLEWGIGTEDGLWFIGQEGKVNYADNEEDPT